MNDASVDERDGTLPHPATVPVHARALRYGAVVACGIALIGSLVGLVVAGPPGAFSALLGAGLAAIFMGLTVASVLVAMKVTKGSPPPDLRFFGIVVGTWLLKIIFFVVVAFWLGGQSWLDPTVFFFTSLAAVIGTLVVDVVAVQTSRVPYVEVPLPGDGSHSPNLRAPKS